MKVFKPPKDILLMEKALDYSECFLPCTKHFKYDEYKNWEEKVEF